MAESGPEESFLPASSGDSSSSTDSAPSGAHGRSCRLVTGAFAVGALVCLGVLGRAWMSSVQAERAQREALSWGPNPAYLFCNYAYSFDPDVKEHEGVLATQACTDILSLQGNSGKSVAVVSSSPALLDTGYGPLIDDHDIVIRFNFAPTRGYIDDVGSKTHIRIMGRNWIFREGDEVIIHRYDNSNHDLYIERDGSLMRLINNSDTNILYSFNMKFLTYARDLFDSTDLSSGAIGAALALRLFGNVTLFGFTTAYSDNHKGMWHYYNDTENAEGPVADFYRGIGVDEYERELLISSSTDLSKATTNHGYSSEWSLYAWLQQQGRLTRFEGDV